MKRIRGAADLAVHGAAPAFAQALHVGRPNLAPRALFEPLVDEIFQSRWLTNNGPLLQRLEQRLTQYLGVRNCVAMCNGTIALEIAIRALDLTGEVIVPSYTFIATAHALNWQGITPVFADIDRATHNLDPRAVASLITPLTSGIIGVHLWGRPAPHADLAKIAEDHRLALLYDAAHAFGCSHRGHMIGGLGRCEVFSFHATKVFNTFEGGAVTTDDDALAEKMRLMRNFGFAGYDNVVHPGTNGKMTEISAAMGLANLDSLADFIGQNRRSFECYASAIERIPGIRLLKPDAHTQSNYHYVVMEVESRATRDRLVEILHAENVIARKYFWPGCHRMQPYRDQATRSPLQNTEFVAERVLVLPNGPDVSADAVSMIARMIEIGIQAG